MISVFAFTETPKFTNSNLPFIINLAGLQVYV